jgi:hypothetical protein
MLIKFVQVQNEQIDMKQDSPKPADDPSERRMNRQLMSLMTQCLTGTCTVRYM